MKKNNFINPIPPMGIYETLYAFQNSFGKYMGSDSTHPWSQGYPLTTQLPGGPKMPEVIDIKSDDLKYPKAWGLPSLRKTIASYYNHYYGSNIDHENVMIFSGGRPGLFAVLMLLFDDIQIQIASTEYTPYYDMLKLTNRKYSVVDSGVHNDFYPSISDYKGDNNSTRKLILLSNPCNPTGVTRSGKDLNDLINETVTGDTGLLIDEAYELFHSPPTSAAKYIKNINQSNLFIAGAATKGLQAPGIRIGWIISSHQHIKTLGNFSSFGMGGVSRPSQLYAEKLFDRSRTELAIKAIPSYYSQQRQKYKTAFKELGLELFSGEGGFYHWCRLPGNLDAEKFNNALFKYGAAILKGTDCDMRRLGKDSLLKQFFRFSFGPLKKDTFESDIKIIKKVLNDF